MKKVLSIIIPVYNVEKYLARCLDSILNQNISNYEIILVDDGSKDKSGDICDEYSTKYRNVNTYHKENGGASDARNYGIKKATGDYIWFIDSDDYIDDDCLGKIIDIMKNKESDVIICQSKIAEDNKSIRDECSYTIKKGMYDSHQFMLELKRNPKSVIFCPQCYIVSKHFLKKHNLLFYKGIIYEDELWIPQLLINANKIYYSGLNIYYHYMHSASVMHSTKKEKSGKSAYIVATELLKIFENSGRDDLDYLRDHNTTTFLQAIWKIPNFLDNKKNIMRTMPIKNAIYLRTKLKALLYFISPKLYLAIHNIREKFMSGKGGK